LLLKYVQVFMVQTAHTAIANARAKLDERFARWILMADGRLDGTSLPLTHEFLSLMLGVRRAGVTEALRALKAQKLIRAARGAIVVLNRRASSARPAPPTALPKQSFGA
jgi:CRP-like cAMP-binding protein